MLLANDHLVFIPDYRFFSVRDYDMFEKPGAPQALAAAHSDIVAANEYEIFVVCAQDQLKIELTVELHDRPVTSDMEAWDGSARFTIPFPTANLHAGDAFGNVINIALPSDGTYTVQVQYAGRDDAMRALQQVQPQATELQGDEARDVFDQWAGVEKYRVTLFPDA